uniref:Reverse transcriptase zinc-binding domain-containing protein n=1 Tax=Seriola dumerili TaxID=41447 RepID=A0A3B4VFF8_SERDU
MKILFRSYITPHKLMKMNSDVSDKCWHGCGKTGTLIHLLWHCPETKTFWLKVRDYLCTLFERNFSSCPVVCLLGNKIDGVISKELQHLVHLAFLSEALAKQLRDCIGMV